MEVTMFRRTRDLIPALSFIILACAACAAPAEPTERQTSAISGSLLGSIMPFGGFDGTCVAATSGGGLQIAPCGDSGTLFFFNGFRILGVPDETKCLDLNYGDLATGAVSMVPCNDGINQRWAIVGGQIVSENRSDGKTHCLDVHFGAHSIGTPIDLAPCVAGASDQVFWTAGSPMEFASTMSHLTTNPTLTHPECLDVLYDNETVGAPLDDSDCNGLQAQWFTLDQFHQVHLSNNTALCLGITGFLSVPNGFSVGLVECAVPPASPSPLQQWFFTNRGRNATGGLVSLNNMSSGCLDIFGGSNVSPTSVDVFTCNGGGAQMWQPTVFAGPVPLNNNGGQVLSAPKVYQLYYGTWWNSPVGHNRMIANEAYVAAVVGYINGNGAPANQKPFLRQYGVNSATLATPPSAGIADNLQRLVNYPVGGATIELGSPTSQSSFTLPAITFDSSYVGGSVTIHGAGNAANEAAFVITGTVPNFPHSVRIAPGPNNTGAQPVTETLPSTATAWIAHPRALSDTEATGGANSIERIVENARAAGLVPNTNSNVVILVFPSFDFARTGDANVGTAYHTTETNGAHASVGVLFERVDEPAPLMESVISHETFEAATDPFATPLAWANPSGELCDGPCTSGSAPTGNFTANGVQMSTGFDNTLGGACTSTGYIPQ
jgi:hypothetical protein